MAAESIARRFKRFRRKLKSFLRRTEGKKCVRLFRLYYLLRSRIAQHLKLERVPFLPYRIDIEPIDTCNFACDHCQVTHWKRPTTRLTTEMFGRILKQFPRLLSIKLQGMGEPFLNKHLMEMLEECERRGIDVEVSSNGSVYTENIASRLTSLRGFLIVFSIDGATAETFEAIRKKGNFKEVADHVADLVRRRGEKTWPRIEIRTVATLRNAHEQPDIVRLAKRLGVDGLIITTVLTDWGKEEMQASIVPIDISGKSSRASQARRYLREAEAIGDGIGIPVVVERGPRYSASNRCLWPWDAAYIAANGDVVPCCQIADSAVVKMGNLFDETFSAIWNNEKYRELRRRISDNDIPHYCRGCYGMIPAHAANE